MSKFWCSFRSWFISLMALFVVLNLLGFVFGFGETKQRTAGFPWSIARWTHIGEYQEAEYFPLAIMPNAVVAVIVSLLLAFRCASSHQKRSNGSNGNDTFDDGKEQPTGTD
jgi:hypothetical protein